MSEPLPDFDSFKPIEVPFTYQGKQYILKEASAEAARRYANGLHRAARMESTEAGGVKVVGIGDLADVETELVANCCFAVVLNAKTNTEVHHPLTLANVRSWPDRVVKPLFDKCKEISPSLTPKETKKRTRQDIEADMAKLQAELEELEGNG